MPKATRSKPETPNSNRGFDAQFLCDVPRSEPLILDGVIASVDSIRLKFIFASSCYDFDSHKRCDTLVKVLEALNDLNLWNERLFDIDPGYEHGFKCGSYQRTIRYSHPDGWSFVVLAGRYCTAKTASGAGFNSARQVAAEAVMDFNPNKVPRRAWERVAGILRSWAVCVPTVQRYDLAMDFSLERSGLELQRPSGTGYQKFVDPSSGAITEYAGERSHHGAVKLYDKGAELGLDTDCTRLEITIDPKKHKGVGELFPTILSAAPLNITTDFSELPFPVQAVLIHPDLYSVLKASCHRNTWKKYEAQLREYNQNAGDTVLSLSTDQQKKIDRYARDYIARTISGTIGGGT